VVDHTNERSEDILILLNQTFSFFGGQVIALDSELNPYFRFRGFSFGIV